jgi:hypothetical protein
MSESTINMIEDECDRVKSLLVDKNRAYGNSFEKPLNIFSQLSAEDALNVRIDDKLNRILHGQDKAKVPEDTEIDLIGYLVLKRVLRRMLAEAV